MITQLGGSIELNNVKFEYGVTPISSLHPELQDKARRGCKTNWQ